MARINLHEPRFTQAQVLECVPGLTAKTLQNWLAPARGIFPIEQRPGRQGKIRWSALQIISLAYMVIVVRLGIPPHASFALSDPVRTRALDLHRSIDPVPWREGLDWHAGVPDHFVYDQLYVATDHHEVFRQYFRSTEHDVFRKSNPGAYIVVEVDRIVLDTLNLIARLPLGREADPRPIAPATSEVLPERMSARRRRASGK